MILKRFYDEPLAQASYMIGCAATGEALVVDPLRDVTPYLESAKAEGLEIKHVTETHIHADFVSGTRELASRTGAQMYLSGEGGPDWSYAFAQAANATLLRDGDRFKVGNVQIDVMHTPGHTPEHLTFLVTDTVGADRPMGAFTGDFVFVGDVGRPDLLERAAKIEGAMEAGARDLYRSLDRFKKLDDWLQIWPGHGAGSACGKDLGAVPTSTLGYERRYNWGFSYTDEDSFVAAVLAGQPEPPVYFAEMKRQNRDGPDVLGERPRPRTLASQELDEILAGDATLVDTRPKTAFAAGHLPGSLSIPLDRQFTTYAGWLLPYRSDLVLIAESPERATDAIRNLQTIGLDQVRGLILPSAISAWTRDGRELETTARISTAGLVDVLESGAFELLDVRWQAEWNAGHIPEAKHLPLGDLPTRLEQITRTRPLVVYCETGARAGVAASVLQAGGITDVRELQGGFALWTREGRPVERGESRITAPR